MPKRVARTRSYAVGVPPRSTWPRIVTRVSKPVRRSISSATTLLMPPRRTWPNSSTPRRSAARACPRRGTAPSATTTIEKFGAVPVAVLDARAHLVDVERHLGHEHDVGAAGDARVHGDPARVAAHHLHDHHPVVALGRGVQPVDGVGGDLHRGVEPEGEVGGRRGRCRSSSARPPRRRPARRRAGPRPRACPRRRWRSARRCARARACRSTRATPSSVLYGLVRDVPRMVPPRWMSPRVVAMVSSIVSPSITPRQPWRNPTTGRRTRPRPCARRRGSPR